MKLAKSFELGNPGAVNFGIERLEHCNHDPSWINSIGDASGTFDYFQTKVEYKLQQAQMGLKALLDVLGCLDDGRKDFRFELINNKDIEALIEMQLEIKFVLDIKRAELDNLLRST